MPNYAQGWEIDPITGQTRTQQSTDSHGIHSPGATEGLIGDELSYGGYRGTAKRELGGLIADPGASGNRDAVRKYQGIAEAAANRGAYKADYRDANLMRGRALEARMGNAQGLGQDGAMRGLAAAAAGSAPSATDSLRQGALDSGLQGALSASAGARGMAGTFAARQAYGQMAGQQVSNAASMAGMRADEMAAARDAYIGGGMQQRGQDLRTLGMSDQRAVTQLDSEIAQRQLNQQHALGYEGLAAGVNQATLNQASSMREARAGIYNNALKARTDDAAAQMRNQAGWASVVGTGMGALAGYASKQKPDGGND